MRVSVLKDSNLVSGERSSWVKAEGSRQKAKAEEESVGWEFWESWEGWELCFVEVS